MISLKIGGFMQAIQNERINSNVCAAVPQGERRTIASIWEDNYWDPVVFIDLDDGAAYIFADQDNLDNIPLRRGMTVYLSPLTPGKNFYNQNYDGTCWVEDEQGNRWKLERYTYKPYPKPVDPENNICTFPWD